METVPTLESVRRDALRLSQDERELLALDLALSVEKAPGYDEAWGAEIERRLKEVDEGKAGLMDWEDAKRHILGDEDEPDSMAAQAGRSAAVAHTPRRPGYWSNR